MLKHKLYQYFINQFLKNFFLLALSLSLLMLLTQAAKFLTIVTDMGNSFLTYFNYIILNYPKILEKIIPLSFLISIFFTVSKLSNEKELNIFWYSGISQKNIFKIIFKLTFFIFLFYYFLSIYFSPYTSSLARKVMAESNFSLINSLVKEKNFNSPLKKITIYVDENDKKGNLKKVFIYENERTIISKKAKVFKNNDRIYLELIEGITLERANNTINKVEFKRSIFDFSNFSSKNLTVEKFSERSIVWLIQNLNTVGEKKEDLIYEINKRFIKPLFIFFIAILSTCILYESENSTKLFKKKYIFIFSFLSIVFNEILLGFSSKNFYYSFVYFLIIISLSTALSLVHILKKND